MIDSSATYVAVTLNDGEFVINDTLRWIWIKGRLGAATTLFSESPAKKEEGNVSLLIYVSFFVVFDRHDDGSGGALRSPLPVVGDKPHGHKIEISESPKCNAVHKSQS